jgi:hypothetical protein
MKPRFVIVMLVVLALAVPATMLAQGSKDEQQIRAVGRELTEAFLKGGADAAAVLDKYYADDYTGTRGDGKVLTKAQEIELFKSGAFKYQANEIKESKIRVYGNTAVSTSLSFSDNVRNGKRFSGTTRNVRFWVKQHGSWKCVYYQTTRVLTPTAAQTKEQLVGTYRLLSYRRTVSATGESEDLYGKSPQGYITYGREGRMMVLFVKDERPTPSDLAKMTDQERANLFKTMVAYGGTYDFDGKTVTHHIDVSWNQIWTGTDVFRTVAVDGRRITLTTKPAPNPTDGKVGVTVLTWEKVE